jgi:hypothetical protein
MPTYTQIAERFCCLKLVVRLKRSVNSIARYNRWKMCMTFQNRTFPCITDQNELYLLLFLFFRLYNEASRSCDWTFIRLVIGRQCL